MSKTRNVAILIFDDVELLDFCGPFEVFSVTSRQADGEAPFNVYTVAEGSGAVMARNGLSVNPRYSIEDCPQPDIVVAPGGYGTRKQMHNESLTSWIETSAREAELTLSVCTGALMLARAGLLEGLRATTHHGALEVLRQVAPKATVEENVRFVDNGRVILSAGISAGIDMSLHVVARLLGQEAAWRTAKQMEYAWSPEAIAISPIAHT